MRALIPVETQGDCTLYLSPGISVSSQDIETGFRWLEFWDVLMPLLDYELLAEDYAHEGCSAATGNLLDLRQMVYDERVLFIRHGVGAAPLSVGSSADELLAARDAIEDCEDVDCPLPMLSAIWAAKPLLLALPTAWTVTA